MLDQEDGPDFFGEKKGTKKNSQHTFILAKVFQGNIVTDQSFVEMCHCSTNLSGMRESKSKRLQFYHSNKVLEFHNPKVKFCNFTMQLIACSQFSTLIKFYKCDHPNENQQKCHFTDAVAPQDHPQPQLWQVAGGQIIVS